MKGSKAPAACSYYEVVLLRTGRCAVQPLFFGESLPPQPLIDII